MTGRRTESWRAIANGLAVRINHMPAPDHTPVQSDCGHCSDGLAYQRFMARKNGETTESWKSVAVMLSVRIDFMPRPDHNPVIDACGYCADGLMYQRFVTRLAADGQRMVSKFDDCVEVPLEDLFKDPR